MINKIVGRSINLHKNPRSRDKKVFQKLYIQQLHKLKSIEKWQTLFFLKFILQFNLVYIYLQRVNL